MSHEEQLDSWERAVVRPDWPEQLVAAIYRATETASIGAPFTIRSIIVERSAEPVVLIRYGNDYSPTLGFRWVASGSPPVGLPTGPSVEDAADHAAQWIVMFELGEPLGNQVHYLTEGEDGVLWWGHGYPYLGLGIRD
jgi:hypothetical protein